mgnify:CR=1 FL=1
MKQLPRALRNLAIACVVGSTPVALFAPATAQAQAQPPAAAAAPDQDLRNAVEQFWHLAKVANYEAAATAAQQLASQYASRPAELLAAFEATSSARGDNLDVWMLRWQGVEQLHQPVTELYAALEDGRRTRATDPAYIDQNIQRLSVNERAYSLAIGRLRDSGEAAVQRMLVHLANPDQAEHHAAIRRALRDMGRIALNPLLAATEANKHEVILPTLDVLADLGYDAAVPYLVRVARSAEDNAVKQAAARALARLGVANAESLNAADLYYQLAEKLYYDNASLVADQRRPVAFVWFWEEDRGLQRVEVPSVIFNEIMAMRAAEYALKADPSRGDAVSLWLAANFKREAELPEGQTDSTRAPNQPDAHYYAVSAGTDYVNAVLERAMNDRNSAVALAAARALKQIAGRSNVLNPQQVQPLVAAMRYPDRLVRINAAEAVAMALPAESFTGVERVVPVLAEAVAQTGQTNVVVIVPDQNRAVELVDGLKQANLAAVGGTAVDQALAESRRLPAVDVIVISEELGADQVQLLMDRAAGDPRLEAAAKVIITRSPASAYAVQALHDPLLSVTQATDAAGLAEAVAQARDAAGGLQLDEDAATELALRAADLLERLAISQTAMDVSLAQPTLLAGLSDQRPELVKAVGRVLGRINSAEAQQGLLDTAAAEQTTPDVAVSLFNSLANSAKLFGNQLNDEQIQRLQQVVEEAQDLQVRSAAAEARGALNLPPEKATQVIINQSRT